jgi:hypothetical protein
MPFGGLRKTAPKEVESVVKSPLSRENSRSRRDNTIDQKSRDPTPRREKTPLRREKTPLRREKTPLSRTKSVTPSRAKTPLRKIRGSSPLSREKTPPKTSRSGRSPIRSRKEPEESFCKGHEEYEAKIRELETKLAEREADYNELYDQMGDWEEIFNDPNEYRTAYEARSRQDLFDVFEEKFIKHLQNTGKWPSIKSSPSLTRISASPMSSVKPYESRYARIPSHMIMRSGPFS